MYCRNCGQELPNEVLFCSNCGTSQDTGLHTCTIDYEKLHPFVGFKFRFVAKATGSRGGYRAKEGPPFASSFVDCPHEEDPEAQAAYSAMVENLLADGWEYLGPQGLWCCGSFQRNVL
jgi:hypothetical protein